MVPKGEAQNPVPQAFKGGGRPGSQRATRRLAECGSDGLPFRRFASAGVCRPEKS